MSNLFQSQVHAYITGILPPGTAQSARDRKLLYLYHLHQLHIRRIEMLRSVVNLNQANTSG